MPTPAAALPQVRGVVDEGDGGRAVGVELGDRQRREVEVQSGEQFEPGAETLPQQRLDRRDVADHEDGAGAVGGDDAAARLCDAVVDGAERLASRRRQFGVGQPGVVDVAVAGVGLAEGETLPFAEVRIL